ncbi:MAG: folylpolyglutamate synthase/dihydrofolate synthase family protein [Bacteroidales bacterium]|nr:folylpolyglutamate synthase/dihydrofolate synthase family protein [Bacteroidales bacterium]
MDFQQTVNFLYKQVPVFQNIGASAYKPGLDNTKALDEYFNHPHTFYKTIHVAGTNGKGSVSHTLAAILQSAGYNVGLYTSPHLVDFRERIRVNGQMISKDYVVDFVEKNFDNIKDIKPSFFELTMMMAFCYFKESNVDVAVIEVGLGGRLDSTNIISPEIGVITNISFDHTQFLGKTLEAIAHEKAGIIKKDIPAVIGEAKDNVKNVFLEKSIEVGAPIVFAEENNKITASENKISYWLFQTTELDNLIDELGGECQIKNCNTILNAVDTLKEKGFIIEDKDIYKGFANVVELTGLQGRWQKIGDKPLCFCDTGHNIGGFTYIVEQLKEQNYTTLRIVIGMVNDKDIDAILSILPKDAVYYFTQASVERALSAEKLIAQASEHGLKGKAFNSVEQAYNAAIKDSDVSDFVFVGGSNFIIGDLFNVINNQALKQ